MKKEDLKNLLEENTDLLDPATRDQILANLDSMKPEVIDFIADQVKAAKQVMQVADDLTQQATQVYQEAGNRLEEMKQKALNDYQDWVKKEEKSEHEAAEKSAEELLSNL